MMVGPGDLIAVTGGTGAVGRRVVSDLLKSGVRVRLLSRAAVPDAAIEQVLVDLGTDDRLPEGALEGCSAVVHLAAYIPSNQEDAGVAKLCFQTNALGTLKLLQAMEEASVQRLVQTTSANAYASDLQAPVEEDPMYPAGRAPFYLSSKLVQDIFGAYWSNRRGLQVSTLRLSSVYGAGVEGSLLTRFARALRLGEQIRLANGGSFGADFVDIADVSNAVALLLRSGASGAFNIASGERTTLLEAARLLLELTGCASDRLVIEPVRVAECGFPRMDITKARECGFHPTDVRTGLANLVRWIDEEQLRLTN